MAEYDNRQQLANHIDDEGGLYSLLRRGTTAADLPPDDTELHTAWQQLDAAWQALSPAADTVMALLPEPSSADDDLVWDRDDKDNGAPCCDRTDSHYHCGECGEITSMMGHLVGGPGGRLICDPDERAAYISGLASGEGR